MTFINVSTILVEVFLKYLEYYVQFCCTSVNNSLLLKFNLAIYTFSKLLNGKVNKIKPVIDFYNLYFLLLVWFINLITMYQKYITPN